MGYRAWIGVDPGKTGAMVLISEDGDTLIHDYSGMVDAHETLMAWMTEYSVVGAAVERQHAFPGQGVSSMFSLGENYGAWQQLFVCHAIPLVTVAPKDWQKGLIPPKSHKDYHLDVARKMFPHAELILKKHHGRADALLIADWLRRR